jgi:hypothetical protein
MVRACADRDKDTVVSQSIHLGFLTGRVDHPMTLLMGFQDALSDCGKISVHSGGSWQTSRHTALVTLGWLTLRAAYGNHVVTGRCIS